MEKTIEVIFFPGSDTEKGEMLYKEIQKVFRGQRYHTTQNPEAEGSPTLIVSFDDAQPLVGESKISEFLKSISQRSHLQSLSF